MRISPRELPELRAATADFVASDVYIEACREIGYCPPFADPKWTDDKKFEVEGVFLRHAELFFVSREMGALAAAAAPTLPRFGLNIDDLPSPVGWIFFEDSPLLIPHGTPPEPQVDYEITAVLWICHPRGLVFYFYTDRDRRLSDSLAAGVSDTGEVETLRSVEPRITTIPGRCLYSGWKAENENEHAAQLNLPIRTLRSAWLLMQQPLAEISEAIPERHARKRLRRAGHEAAVVRVIELRRPTRDADTDPSGREYHHQWIVRGHWRQQWYPARQVHRPVWIAPHVKGPEGAPLLGGEKVHAWVR
jgi:hypothetical protein